MIPVYRIGGGSRSISRRRIVKHVSGGASSHIFPIGRTSPIALIRVQLVTVAIVRFQEGLKVITAIRVKSSQAALIGDIQIRILIRVEHHVHRIVAKAGGRQRNSSRPKILVIGRGATPVTVVSENIARRVVTVDCKVGGIELQQRVSGIDGGILYAREIEGAVACGQVDVVAVRSRSGAGLPDASARAIRRGIEDGRLREGAAVKRVAEEPAVVELSNALYRTRYEPDIHHCATAAPEKKQGRALEVIHIEGYCALA